MKKFSIMVLIIMMVGTLAACGGNNNEAKLNDTPKEEVVVTEIEESTNEETAAEDSATDRDATTEKSADNIDTKAPEKSEEDTKTVEKTEVDKISAKENWSAEANVSENEDGTLRVDYMITAPDGTTHSFSEKPDFDKSWYEMYKDAGGELYEFVDFNFDGHTDIKTQQYGAMVNQYYNIRIWNESIGEFELNQDYMNLSNPEVNADKKQIFTTNYDRGLGNYSLYEVKDGVLTEIAAIKVKINNDGTYGYTETIGEGEGKTIKSISDIDPIWEGYNVNIQ